MVRITFTLSLAALVLVASTAGQTRLLPGDASRTARDVINNRVVRADARTAKLHAEVAAKSLIKRATGQPGIRGDVAKTAQDVAASAPRPVIAADLAKGKHDAEARFRAWGDRMERKQGVSGDLARLFKQAADGAPAGALGDDLELTKQNLADALTGAASQGGVPGDAAKMVQDLLSGVAPAEAGLDMQTLMADVQAQVQSFGNRPCEEIVAELVGLAKPLVNGVVPEDAAAPVWTFLDRPCDEIKADLEAQAKALADGVVPEAPVPETPPAPAPAPAP